MKRVDSSADPRPATRRSRTGPTRAGGRGPDSGLSLHLRRRLTFIALGASAYLGFLVLSRIPGSFGTNALTAVGERITSLLTVLSSGVPFPLAELLLLALLLRWVVGVGLDLRRTRRTTVRWGPPLASAALRPAGDLGLLVFLFYLIWGFGYAAEPLEQRLGLDPSPLEVEELRELAHEMVEAANREYRTIHGAADAGVPTQLPAEAWSATAAELARGWARVGPVLELGRGGSPLTVKPLRLGRGVRHLGISGLYVPFTGEALVVPDLPGVSLPMTMAHETAHQLGVAHEGDANFAGFLAASRSQDAILRYSAFVFAQRQMLAALAPADPESVEELAAARLPGVTRDLADLRRYWAEVEGVASEVGERVNHAYLRRQGVAEGVRSYAMSTQALVRFARTQGGSLLPDEARTGEDG